GGFATLPCVMNEIVMKEKLQVAVIGASGYGGAELARLLAAHPHAHLARATASGERAGARLSDLFPSLRGLCDVVCEGLDIARLASDCAFVFISLPHGKAMEIVPALLERGLKVCDIGADFRLRDAEVFEQWYKHPHTASTLLQEAVYGLPEWNREKIKAARLVANPGCYPTSAILALSPFVAEDLVRRDSIIVDAASGTSGAGRSSFGLAMHHPEISGDFKAYNVATHRHTPEIEQGLTDVVNDQAKEPLRITFTAHLLPIARGILSTCYATLHQEISTAQAQAVLQARYADEPFVRVLPAGQMPQIKHVAGSNFCDIGVQVDERTNRLIVIAAEDNLVKGAAGQALQNMNLMCGFEETAGLLSAPLFP
ncbi:MAG TPA: N-acetyl-gamma-glutamyl-phosphate reductase, partial [Abditibacteriaceae bacterium]|nr:N-acetyl-gamma-glutamyl-phosphate reductase [Abditibacteriaceae bacterium]